MDTERASEPLAVPSKPGKTLDSLAPAAHMHQLRSTPRLHHDPAPGRGLADQKPIRSPQVLQCPLPRGALPRDANAAPPANIPPTTPGETPPLQQPQEPATLPCSRQEGQERTGLPGRMEGSPWAQEAAVTVNFWTGLAQCPASTGVSPKHLALLRTGRTCSWEPELRLVHLPQAATPTTSTGLLTTTHTC